MSRMKACLENLLEAVEVDGHGRVPHDMALATAEHFVERLSYVAGVTRVEIAGSLRRQVPTVRDIDLVCESDDGESVIDEFTGFDGIAQVVCAGKTKATVVVGNGLHIDLRVVPAESFGTAMQHCTGSKEHNVELRQQARRMGYKLNEYGLYNKGQRIAGDDEADVYAKLGFACLRPELRSVGVA